jgi:Cd2+/Zn2+-exporting ATPase
LKPNTKLLTVIATAGALAIGEWFEAAVSMYLFSAAELLEAWNMDRARKSIRVLMELAPSTAQVVNNKDGFSVTEQPVDQVPVGATILIKPGEKIPMDSELISEFTSVNQAPITGESMPVQKETGDPLFAGTINGDVAVYCRVTKAASDSTLASIIKKVEEAQSNRAQTDQWIEKFANYYVPFMMLASVIVAIIPPLASKVSWYSWIYKGLQLLVISCPCSLIISTPVSIVAGITAAARVGVLIKGGIHLENAAAIKAFAMDKTGTITTGEPIVQSIIPLDGVATPKEILQLATALEVHSDHPLARAIQRKAKDDGITYPSAEQFKIFKGKGGEGIIKGKLYWIGSHRFLHEKLGDKESPALHERINSMETAGQSIVAIGYDLEICGLIGIADSVRPQSKKAIEAIKQAGVHSVVMLTGDSQGAAKVIADAVNIDDYKAELLPEDKVKQVEALVNKYRNVAMVGDGVNDAPAMAAAMVGIAMGTAGSDTAIETADIALMADDLGKLAWLIKHARHTLNIIKQNVVFSLLIKILFAGLTFANRSSLWLAIVADMGTTFVVVSNSLRLVGGSSKSGKSEKGRAEEYRIETVSNIPLVLQEDNPSPVKLRNAEDIEMGPNTISLKAYEVSKDSEKITS